MSGFNEKQIEERVGSIYKDTKTFDKRYELAGLLYDGEDYFWAMVPQHGRGEWQLLCTVLEPEYYGFEKVEE